MNSIQLLIKDICQEEGISFQMISKDWIAVLEKNGKTHYITGSRFDLNNYASARICNDKYACYSALKYHHIPVCEYQILYPNTPIEEVEGYFNQFQKDVVVKANEGSFGDAMYHVEDFVELQDKMNILFQKYSSISISPFYSILCEYRIIVLDDEVLLIYGKKRAEVIGDGVHTVYELLCEFNPPFFQKMDEHSSLDYVLEKNQKYSYGWQHNISKGSVPYLIDDEELKHKLSSIALDAVKKLNLRFVSVDIVELDNHDLKIIEINSGVITNVVPYIEDGDRIAEEIYHKAVCRMFQEK